MKVFAKCGLQDNAIERVAKALMENIPGNVELVGNESEADLVVVYAYAHKRWVQYQTNDLINQGKKYAIIQFSVRSTSNPLTIDWLPIWENAELVWSYYNLLDLCKEDGNRSAFNFYYAPLGVDSSIFKEANLPRKFVIAGTGTGRGWNKECKNEVLRAAKGVNKPVFQLGIGDSNQEITYSNGMGDETLSKYYSQCDFVSGLRRIEGFELPVLEGLLCGARPIVFDRPHYKHWFSRFAEFIPEDDRREENVLQLFQKGAKPITNEEKDFVKRNFNWKTISEGFWKNIT